jgi:hypothetical protein
MSARKTVFSTPRPLRSSRPATVRSGSPSTPARKPTAPTGRVLDLLEPRERIDFSAFKGGCATIQDECQSLWSSLQEAHEQIVRLEKENADLKNYFCASMFNWIQTGASADTPMQEPRPLGAMPTVATPSGTDTGGFDTILPTILPATPAPIAVASPINTLVSNISAATPSAVVLRTTSPAPITIVETVNGNEEPPNTTSTSRQMTPPSPSESSLTSDSSYEAVARILSYSPTITRSSIAAPELGVNGNTEIGDAASTRPMTSRETECSTNNTSMRSPPPRKFSDIIRESEEAEREIVHFSLAKKTDVDEAPDRSPRSFNLLGRLRGLARFG